MKPVSVGVIGLGYWGPNLLRNFAEHAAYDLRWACDQRQARLDFAAKRYPAVKTTTDFEALLKDSSLDAVAIATPVASHLALARAALQAGKHVLLEKPMARSVAEADELIALAAKHKRVLLIDHTFLFTPAVQQIKQRIDRGDLGQLYVVDGVRINLGLFQHDVNVLWDLAPHDLSIALYVLGKQPLKVTAIGASHTSGKLEDVAHLHLDFGGNLLAHFHASWLSPVKIRQMVFGGSKRTLIFNDLEPTEKIRLHDAGVDLQEPDEQGREQMLVSYRRGDILIPNLDMKEALTNEVEHFHACITRQQPCISDGVFGREIVRILAAADESMKTGRSVSLQ